MGFRIVLPKGIDYTIDVSTAQGTRFFYDDSEITHVVNFSFETRMGVDEIITTTYRIEIAEPILVESHTEPIQSNQNSTLESELAFTGECNQFVVVP